MVGDLRRTSHQRTNAPGTRSAASGICGGVAGTRAAGGEPSTTPTRHRLDPGHPTAARTGLTPESPSVPRPKARPRSAARPRPSLGSRGNGSGPVRRSVRRSRRTHLGRRGPSADRDVHRVDVAAVRCRPVPIQVVAAQMIRRVHHLVAASLAHGRYGRPVHGDHHSTSERIRGPSKIRMPPPSTTRSTIGSPYRSISSAYA